MAINLASKYAKELAQAFTEKSYVDGIASKDYEFTGVKTLKVYTAVSQALNDYKRSGSNRYGEPQEAQDTVQNMTVERDRSFSITVDKGNNAEQLGAKEASKVLAIEMQEQAVPEMDKYALGRFCDFAGKINMIAEEPTEELTVETIELSQENQLTALVPEGFQPLQGRGSESLTAGDHNGIVGHFTYAQGRAALFALDGK